MTRSADEVFAQMRRGVNVLFLGQKSLALETGVDPLLSQAAQKYSAADGPGGYDALLTGSAGQIYEQALAWMDERCRRIPTPHWLDLVASFSWNALFTSAVDSVLPRAFTNEWRTVQPIFLEKHVPSDPRNVFQINCTHLFGSVSRTDAGERPPMSRFEWYTRRQSAVALARRIPEVVTPMGLLFIEGFEAANDWLKAEDLYGPLSVLLPGQVQFFSISRSTANDEFVRELIRRGIVEPREESLANFLRRGSEGGSVRLGVRPEQGPLSRQLTLGGDVKHVPRDLWTQLARSAILLGDAVEQPPTPLSKEAVYEELRSALDTSEGVPRWSAYNRGLFFRRHFERRLREEANRILDITRLVYRPIILHGPTGSGKTVALGRLALEVKRDRRAAVLYIERKTVRPSTSHIDQFCRWAEDAGAEKCLIVWDGMLEPRDYDQFLGDLTGRGRKVAVVGSSYFIDPKHAKTDRFVHAEPILKDNEADEFLGFIKNIAGETFRHVTPEQVRRSPTFLVALYRILTPTRKRIAFGVYSETDWSQDRIARRAAAKNSSNQGVSTLAAALARAGLSASPVGESDGTPAFVDPIHGDLTGLIMVPGKYGLSVPLDLLMRALGEKHFELFAELFEGVDIFRWHEDQQQNISIGARNALEAKLIADARLGGPKGEIDSARRILSEVSEKGGLSAEQPEISFAVELIKRLREDAENSPTLAGYFRDLADTLRELREKRGVNNSRLLLQEANMLREWAMDQSRRQGTSTSEERLRTFEDAEEVCRQALELLGASANNRDLKARLLVELASATAAKTKNLILRDADALVIRENYDSTRKSLQEALVLDPSNYYAVDVLAWATEDVLSSDLLEEKAAADAIADVLHAFETAPVAEFDLAQLEKYNERRLHFADTLELHELSDVAFQALQKQGSAAGFYLRALRIAGFDRGHRVKQPEINACRQALAYLERSRSDISHDSRCLDLMLDLWWFVHAGSRLFEGERVVLPFNDQEWRTVLQIVTEIENGGNSGRPGILAFLRGLALFHLRNVGQCLITFGELERESDQLRGPRRIIRSYLASTPNGNPWKFFGEVKWAQGNKGKVFVPELRNEIDFRPYEFGMQEPRPGMALGEFHIAFNFRGPIADPAMHYKK